LTILGGIAKLTSKQIGPLLSQLAISGITESDLKQKGHIDFGF
jgi:hypothetical protein